MRLILIFLFIFSPIVCANADEQESPSKIYQYKDKAGVSVFTNNINSVPEPFRKQVKVLEVKPEAKIEKSQQTLAPNRVFNPLYNPFIRNIIIGIVVLVLLWVLKLWIKNMILAFVARLAIKAAIIGFLYILAHQWYFAPKGGSFWETVQNAVAPYRDALPIKKATDGIKAFNKKEKEKKETLETIP